MTTPRAAYCRLLVQKASARQPGSPGNEITDILGKSRAGHTGLSNVTFWDLPTMQVYTPTPEFHAAHSVLQNPGPYPAPMLSGGFPVVTWAQTQGTVSAMAVLPDGSPPVYEIKVLDSDPAGAAAGLPWAFQTQDLGTWEGDTGQAGRGCFGKNRGVAVTIRLGSADTPPADAPSQTDSPATPLGQAASDGSSSGDVRVMVGTQWSVLFPAGQDPAFEQRYPYRDEDGVAHEWVRLHTFAGAVPSRTDGDAPLFLVTFLAVAGRLLVSVGGHSVASESFVYYKPGQGTSSANLVSPLSIASAPVRVTGRAGGGPRWIGIRRILWGQARMRNQMRLQDASVSPSSLPGANTAGQFTVVCARPNAGGDCEVTGRCVSPTLLEYTALLTSSPGGQEPCALKWVFFGSGGADGSGSGDSVDYGGAVTHYRLHIPEPSFNGAGSIFGSRSYCEVTFDQFELAKIAAANNTVWQSDLAAYGAATFITGRDMDDGAGGYSTEEGARLLGYWEKPEFEAKGFNDNSLEMTLSDASILLHEPAAVIDPSWAALDFLNPAGADKVFGYHGVQYILKKAITQGVANSLKVFLPPDWYPLCQLLLTSIVDGQVPSGDAPLFVPPYTKYADEWLKDIQTFDFAAFYFAGEVPVYGQYDLIIAGLPTHDAYTGESGGLPADVPFAEVTWVVKSAKNTFDTAKDFNDFALFGRPPGADDAATQLGVPIVYARSRDAARISQSWQRTRVVEGAMFYDQAAADRNTQEAVRLTGGDKAAQRYEAVSPFPHPTLFWGHKLTFHGGVAANLDGKTLRIIDLVEEGNGNSQATTTLKLVEMI